MKKKIFKISIIFLIPAVLMLGYTWDDFKLKLSPLRAYFTVNNNPLIIDQDHDLEVFNEEGTERILAADLKSGGPGKDGIPSINSPKFVSRENSVFSDDELIIGVSHNGVFKAYPYGILNWHEVVNDEIGGLKIAVTYCPLCETNNVFVREINNKEYSFGVSGKLFNSCLVMFDRQTDSLWSQPWGLGVAGEKNNDVLVRVPAERTTLGQWMKAHPDSQVLSTDTGYSRNYKRYPYGSYYTDESIIFPARNQDNLKHHPKEIMQIVFEHDSRNPQGLFSGEKYVISQSELKEKSSVSFFFQSKKITAVWDNTLNTARFYDGESEIPSMALFAFVYQAYFE